MLGRVEEVRNVQGIKISLKGGDNGLIVLRDDIWLLQWFWPACCHFEYCDEIWHHVSQPFQSHSWGVSATWRGPQLSKLSVGYQYVPSDITCGKACRPQSDMSAEGGGEAHFLGGVNHTCPLHRSAPVSYSATFLDEEVGGEF